MVFSLGEFKIQINESIIALASYKSLNKENIEIIFYNNNSKQKHPISGYSFTKSQNNLALINENILLCACTKYTENQKNGILLIKIKNDEVDEKSKNFYDTKNFEVHCFSPKIIFNNDIFLNLQKIKYSDYFFVGGFDTDKKEGLIKIYKVDSNDEIKFIKDIEIDKKHNFQGFKKPISCIIQSKSTKNIIITDLGGYVYLFSKPNFNNL